MERAVILYVLLWMATHLGIQFQFVINKPITEAWKGYTTTSYQLVTTTLIYAIFRMK